MVCSQFPQGYTASGNLQEAVVNICGYDCIADDNSGADVSYTHDAANNLTSVTAVPFVYGTDGPSTTLFAATAYNAIGQATGAGLDVVSGVVGMTMSRSYDSRERITAETDLGVSGGNIYNYSLAGGYAANGNVTGFTDSVMGSWAYGYGHKNQLISGSASAGPYSGLNLSWTYDSFGNRGTQGVSGNTSVPVPSPQTLHYTTSNQIIGYTYDLDGNLTDDGINRYQYDAENRLCAVYNYTGSGALTSYAYGPDGSRLAKGTISSFTCDFTMNGGLSPTNLYAVGPSGEQLDEVDENYDALHANVFLNGRVLATYSAEIDSNWHFSFDDWLGTRRVQQDAYQDTEGTFLSLPFGDNLTLTGNPGATENQFTSKERDAESGNDYFGARHYGSSMGRFMSPDPISQSILQIMNPQRWNKYGYALNTPLTMTDPTGKDAAAVTFSGMVATLGHEAIVSINPDGSTQFASFGPGEFTLSGGFGINEPGQVGPPAPLPTIQFGANGLPTNASMDALKNAVAKIEKVNPNTVEINYFKTTPQETANLNAWIKQQKANPGNYKFCTRNCANFTARGLVAGGAITQSQANGLSIDPNEMFDQLEMLAPENTDYYGNATVTTTATNCVTLPDGSQQCDTQ